MRLSLPVCRRSGYGTAVDLGYEGGWPILGCAVSEGSWESAAMEMVYSVLPTRASPPERLRCRALKRWPRSEKWSRMPSLVPDAARLAGTE